MKKLLSDSLKNKLLCGAAALALLAGTAYVATNAAKWQDNYIRAKVGSRVFKILKIEDGHMGGGTGFAVKGLSGQTYIMTNAHVCNGTNVNGSAIVETPDGRRLPRRIIEVSKNTDLCIIEAVPGYEGLDVGPAPMDGDTLTVVGHPKLYSLTLSSGDLIETHVISMLKGVIGMDDATKTEEDCKGKNEEIQDVMSFFGPMKLCIKKFNAYQSNIIILPGNSGSPTVNAYGQVVAVAFAAADDNWGNLITNAELKEFLSAY